MSIQVLNMRSATDFMEALVSAAWTAGPGWNIRTVPLGHVSMSAPRGAGNLPPETTSETIKLS